MGHCFPLPLSCWMSSVFLSPRISFEFYSILCFVHTVIFCHKHKTRTGCNEKSQHYYQTRLGSRFCFSLKPSWLCFPRRCVWSPGWGVMYPGARPSSWCYNCPECGGWRWSVIKLWYQPSFILTSRPPQTDLIPRVIFIRWSLQDTVFISATGEKPNTILDLGKRPSDYYKMGQFDWTSDGWLTAVFLFRFVILCRSCSDLRLWNIKLQLSYSKPLPQVQHVPCPRLLRSPYSTENKCFTLT